MEQKLLISKEDVIFNFHQIERSWKNFRIEIINIIAKKKQSWFLNVNSFCPNKLMSRNHFRKGSERGRKTHFFLFNLCYMKVCLICPPL